MALPDPDRSRAVLIGTSRFTDPDLPDLPAVHNNLNGLAACLRDPGLWGLPPAHCTVLPDPDSLVTLVDAVHDAAAEAEDTLLIYYAGHGLVHPRTLSLLLAVTGSRPGRPHTAVPYDQVRDNVLDSRAARKVVILDCCYSGRALGGMADPTSAVANEASVEGTYLLASAPPNKQALSPPGETYTAFTGTLLALFNDGMPNGPELLQLDAIYRHVRDALKRRSLPEPQLRVDNTAGELALVRNHWHQAPSAPSPPTQKPTVRANPKLVRERIKELAREAGITGTYACPVCVASVSGQNLIRHFDKHTPGETASLDPATLTLSPGRSKLLSDRYELGERIAGEGNTKVYLATDTLTQQAVVVKQLRDEHFDDRTMRLTHQGIVRILDTFRYKRQLHVVTEYVDDGLTLNELMLPLKPHRAVEIMAEVCDALAYAHAQGIVHGNINSGNVIITAGAAKVLNFGTGDATDPRADVYAAGRVLFELITGSKPSLTSTPPPIQPAALASIVRIALSADVAGRYQTAAAMRDDLKRVR